MPGGRVPCGVMRATRPLATLLVAVLLAACGGNSATATPPSTASPSTTPSDGSGSLQPSSSDVPSDVPTDSPEPTPSETASDQPSPTGSSAGGAAACTGTDANREFYAAVAAAVQWAVYCPVLPAGWFVDSGQYRLAGGGRMEISYRGPSGRRLELHEGAFCSASDGCVPSGTDVGAASFGNRPGTLVSTDGGGWAIVVDRGSNPSWLTITTGLDEATTRGFAAKFILVNG